MVNIYTFCDKTLVGKKQNQTSSFLCENLFKMNFKIQETCVFCNAYDYENITFKNKDIYFLLIQKSNSKLTSVLCELSGCETTENATLKKAVGEYYKQKNIPLDNSSSLEWTIPNSAVPITNPAGRTQGYVLKIADTTVFVLPNNYNEFLQIYNDCLREYLENNFVVEYVSETYKTFGLTEENLLLVLKEQIKNKDKVHVSIFCKGLDNDVVIKAQKNNTNFEEYRRVIFSKLENYIYSVHDQSLDENLTRLMQDYNVKLALVGDLSITLLANKLLELNLENNVLECHSLISPESFKKFGLEKSEGKCAENAYDLAISMLNGEADLVMCTLCSGGTTYIALGNKNKIDIYKNSFTGSQNEILENFAKTAQFYLIKKIKLRDFQTF